MIDAVFYARFDAVRGPIALHQWPQNAVAKLSNSDRKPFLDFSSISDFIIPRQDLCQQPLSICTNGYRVLGHPICLVNEDKYARNEFMFNFCIVIEETIDFSACEKVVEQIARVLVEAEEQDQFLFDDERKLEGAGEGDREEGAHRSQMQEFCENVLEDLNNYEECIIPLTDAHELNVKLYKDIPPAPAVEPFHVPLSTVDLASKIDETWDLTMHRVAKYIDGVNHIARIAEYVDADVNLVQQAVRQFLRFGLVVLLDIFQYGAVYAPTPEIQRLLFDLNLQRECADFAAVEDGKVSPETIVSLYTSLSHGLPLKDWLFDHQDQTENIDIRRFIIAGLLKGIIYRVHRYAIKDSTATGENNTTHTDPSNPAPLLIQPRKFDDLCVDLAISPQDLSTRLNTNPNIHIIDR